MQDPDIRLYTKIKSDKLILPLVNYTEELKRRPQPARVRLIHHRYHTEYAHHPPTAGSTTSTMNL